MHNEIPLKYYDIVDEYASEATEPVSEAERDPLACYFQLLLTRLSNNEEISEEAQQEMASEQLSITLSDHMHFLSGMRVEGLPMSRAKITIRKKSTSGNNREFFTF